MHPPPAAPALTHPELMTHRSAPRTGAGAEEAGPAVKFWRTFRSRRAARSTTSVSTTSAPHRPRAMPTYPTPADKGRQRDGGKREWRGADGGTWDVGVGGTGARAVHVTDCTAVMERDLGGLVRHAIVGTMFVCGSCLFCMRWRLKSPAAPKSGPYSSGIGHRSAAQLCSRPCRLWCPSAGPPNPSHAHSNAPK